MFDLPIWAWILVGVLVGYLVPKFVGDPLDPKK